MSATEISLAETEDGLNDRPIVGAPELAATTEREAGSLVARVLSEAGVEVGTVEGVSVEIDVLNVLVKCAQVRLAQCHERLHSGQL